MRWLALCLSILLTVFPSVPCEVGALTEVAPAIPVSDTQKPADELAEKENENAVFDMTITVGGQVFPSKLYENATTKAWIADLPQTVSMSEMNGNEKYYYLPTKLPTNTETPTQINAGDLMLYGSDCFVLFYETFTTSYNYTKIGYVEDVSGLADALGSGSTQVTFSMG